jgi:hypothetical protein
VALARDIQDRVSPIAQRHLWLQIFDFKTDVIESRALVFGAEVIEDFPSGS